MKLKPNHPALTEARTIHTKTVRPTPASLQRYVLKSVADNSKLGKGLGVIIKGKWRGMPMFSVTLQERATCPSDCIRWAECYGNGMGFAHRFEHGAALEAQIRYEVGFLAKQYPHGFVVRLHILGDFYSLAYVQTWRNLVAKHPNLMVFGYTARHTCQIGKAIQEVRLRFPDRFWVRFSRNESHDGASIFAAQEGAVANAITCPEQTGKAQSCLDCGLCWSVDRTIAFVDHDKLAKQRRNHERPGQATA